MASIDLSKSNKTMNDFRGDCILKEEMVKWIEFAADDGHIPDAVVNCDYFWRVLATCDLAKIVSDPIFLEAWSTSTSMRNITYSLGIQIPGVNHHGTLK